MPVDRYSWRRLGPVPDLTDGSVRRFEKTACPDQNCQLVPGASSCEP